MDNEKLILSILQEMQGDIKELKTDVSSLKTDVSTLKTDVADLKVGQANLEAGQAEIRKELGYIWADIKKLDNRLTEQETLTLKRISK